MSVAGAGRTADVMTSPAVSLGGAACDVPAPAGLPDDRAANPGRGHGQVGGRERAAVEVFIVQRHERLGRRTWDAVIATGIWCPSIGSGLLAYLGAATRTVIVVPIQTMAMVYDLNLHDVPLWSAGLPRPFLLPDTGTGTEGVSDLAVGAEFVAGSRVGLCWQDRATGQSIISVSPNLAAIPGTSDAEDAGVRWIEPAFPPTTIVWHHSALAGGQAAARPLLDHPTPTSTLRRRA